MRVPRIFLDADLQENTHCTTPDSIAHYLVKVLRMQSGRELIVFNGRGGEYQAEITEIQKKSAVLAIKSFNPAQTESPLTTHLAVGISRGERWEYVLQKATELGVNTITPLLTSRCEVKLKGERLDKKLAHWRGIIISACEQSRRTALPQFNMPQSFEHFIAQPTHGLPLVLHHRHAQKISAFDQNVTHCTLLIGPEGGLSDEEITASQSQGYQALSLGPRVLRTETAPLAALTAAQIAWGDF